MHKLAERLIDKHLSKVILEITLEVCTTRFDEVFKGACSNPDPKDTTIGTCYRRLEKLAKEAVDIKLGEMMNEVTDEMEMVRRTTTGNPFAAIAYSVWDSFLDNYDIRGFVENIIGEEWEEKRAKLQQDGILDAEGDYTRA